MRAQALRGSTRAPGPGCDPTGVWNTERARKRSMAVTTTMARKSNSMHAGLHEQRAGCARVAWKTNGSIAGTTIHGSRSSSGTTSECSQSRRTARSNASAKAWRAEMGRRGRWGIRSLAGLVSGGGQGTGAADAASTAQRRGARRLPFPARVPILRPCAGDSRTSMPAAASGWWTSSAKKVTAREAVARGPRVHAPRDARAAADRKDAQGQRARDRAPGGGHGRQAHERPDAARPPGAGRRGGRGVRPRPGRARRC